MKKSFLRRLFNLPPKQPHVITDTWHMGRPRCDECGVWLAPYDEGDECTDAARRHWARRVQNVDGKVVEVMTGKVLS